MRCFIFDNVFVMRYSIFNNNAKSRPLRVIIIIIIINKINYNYNNNNKTMADIHMAPGSQPSSQQSMNVESENPKLSKFWHAIFKLA